MKRWPPIKHPSRSDVLVWCDASVVMPGAIQVGASNRSYDHADLPGHVTRVVTVNPSIADAKERPRIVQYSVEPKYTYGAGDQLPAFLKANIQRSRDEIEAARQPGSPYTEKQIKAQVDATDYLVTWGHLLFPEIFTCTAVYWVASYLPDKPWLQQTDTENYDAELARVQVGDKPAAAKKRRQDGEPNADVTDGAAAVSLEKPGKKAKGQVGSSNGTTTTSTAHTAVVVDS